MLLNPSIRRSTLIVSLLLMAGTVPAWAQQGRGREQNQNQNQERAEARAMQLERSQSRDRVDRSRPRNGSLSDSVRRAQRDSRGQVLSAERVPFDGRELHRVKVLDDRGRVRVFMADPRREAREQQQAARAVQPPAPARGNDD